MRVTAAALVVLLSVPGGAAQAPPARTPEIFRFESDEFWLNLHKFLYVLGRAQNGSADASRSPVAGAPMEATTALRSLTQADREAWADAVSMYGKGLSRREPTQDHDLALLEGRLADLDDAPAVDAANAGEPLRAVLQRVAPIYRTAWWPSHRAANRAWVAAMRPLLSAHGPAVLQTITRAYGFPWPAAGYPVHAVTYASWAGAYSTDGNLLIVSTNSGAGTNGFSGLESMFHESIHQWDDRVEPLLDTQARASGVRLPRNLSHAIVFFTAAEAVRRVAPAGYVPLADATGAWDRGMTGLKEALTEVWLPYMNGRGTRDEALAALVKRTAPPPPIFVFQTDDFWLNLHHFLCALGLRDANSPDASAPPIVPAGPDLERGIQRLSADEQRAWAEVVTGYATSWSLKAPNLDEPAAGVVRALAAAGSEPTLAAAPIDPRLREALERAAPLYRRAWWPAHRDANRAWRSQIAPLLAQHGAAVRDYLTRAYAAEWPAQGRTIRVTRYTTAQGAYSLVNGGLILVASVDPAAQGMSGVEVVFHEALHQWDPQTFGALNAQARPLNLAVPRDLPHAMIFFTAGEAVRRVDSTYVPYIDRFDIWRFNLSGASLPASRLKQPLVDAWKPFLDGHGTREAALAGLLERAVQQTVKNLP